MPLSFNGTNIKKVIANGVSMSKVFANGVLVWLSGITLTGTTYDSKSFSVAAQNLYPEGLCFGNSGLSLYYVGDQYDVVIEYSLSVAYDVSTMTYVRQLDIGRKGSWKRGIRMSPFGYEMYVLAEEYNNVHEYQLSTPWNISTATFVYSKSISTEIEYPNGFCFSSDGTKMYITGGTIIYQYTLSSAWVISSATYDSRSFNVNAEEATVAMDVSISASGKFVYVFGYGKTIYRYHLSTAYDISTCVYDNDSYDISANDTQARCVEIVESVKKLYMIGYTNKTVYQYSVL